MIDNFALGLTHFLLAVVFWRLLTSSALDRDEDDVPPPAPPRRPRPGARRS